MSSSRAGAVLAPAFLSPTEGGPATWIIVDDLGPALRQVAALFAPPSPAEPAISPDARIDPTARIGAGACIGPFAVVAAGACIGARVLVGPGTVIEAGVRIGDDVRIGPGAVCCEGTELGDRVLIKANAVVGGAGFRYLRGPGGHVRLPHLGRCILERDVEVGSGTCIDRGNFEDTVIGEGTKIDNLVQVGHNVRMGRHCLVMATTGIAGSVHIGDNVTVAGGVGIADHAVVGDGAVLGAKCVVFGGEIPAGAVVSGYPARPHRTFLRAQAALYRLAESRASAQTGQTAHGPTDDLTAG